MIAPSRALVWCGALLLLCGGRLGAQALLEPPFGLHWGDSPEKLLGWVGRHALDVTIMLPGDEPGLRIIKVQARKGPLPGSQASAVEGRFLSGRLYELTVHYFDREATADAMATRFEDLRKQLSVQHGMFAADRQQRTMEDKYVTKTVAFHREPVKGLLLLLALTEVEDLLRQSRDARFSIIYRNENFKNEMQKEFDGLQAP